MEPQENAVETHRLDSARIPMRDVLSPSPVSNQKKLHLSFCQDLDISKILKTSIYRHHHLSSIIYHHHLPIIIIIIIIIITIIITIIIIHHHHHHHHHYHPPLRLKWTIRSPLAIR